ncbi:MAG: response regulator transcription factor [Gemmatimonadales bacterium]
MSDSPRRRILVVDDEPEIVRLIAFHLELAGYEVISALGGLQGLQLATGAFVSLIVLDLMLPELSGLEILAKLRADPQTHDVPVILLTALREDTDRIRGLAIGADDYLTKPFNPDELVLRVSAILRRSGASRPKGDETVIGDVAIDRSQPRIRICGNEVNLTVTEHRLLLMLADNPGEAQPRQHLLHTVWGSEPDCHTRTLDVHIQRLRVKLGGAAGMIETVRGYGYRMRSLSGTAS